MLSSRCDGSLRFVSLLACILVSFLFSQNTFGAQVNLTWHANSEEDLAGYRVFRRQEAGSYNYDQPAWEGTATTCTIQDLVPNTTYFFVVRAFDTQGLESGDSNEAPHQTPDDGGGNRTPTASTRHLATAEDTSLAIILTATDPDGDSLTYDVLSRPSHGALSGTPPTLTYVPDANYNGPDSFAFKANDGTADSNVATVNITVEAVNDPPGATHQAIITSEDTAVNDTLSASDPDGDGLTYILAANGNKGTATIINAVSGAFTYTPHPDNNGTDAFTFHASDGHLDSNAATVTVTISAVNDVPVAHSDTVTTNEDAPVSVSLSASDADGDGLTYAVVGQPVHGSLSGTAPTMTYTPIADYNGSDAATFKVNDGTADSNVASVTIIVKAVNDPPVADAGADQAVDEQDMVTLNGSASTDPDDGIASYLWEQNGGPPVALSDAGITQPGFSAPLVGPDGASLSFLLTVTDSVGLQSTDTCTVAILDRGPPPDTDRDGVPDEEESLYGTDPNRFDTDGDGYSDGLERDYHADPTDPESMPVSSHKIMAGLGTFRPDGGWIELFGTYYESEFWLKIEWPEYNCANGETRPATGDIDGDGKDEIIIGLGPVPANPAVPQGLFAVLDDDYTHLLWGQIERPDYNEQSGESWPACGDLDGDGDDEVVIGLGVGGGGNFEIFDFASGNLVHKAWGSVDWQDYNKAAGETRPACGDIDGDGKDEIIIGLGPVSEHPSVPGGLFEVLDDDYTHLAWGRIEQPDYNVQNGESWPACGDFDGDGDDEIVIGLGAGGGGKFEIFDYASGNVIHMAWSEIQPEDDETRCEETRPVCGNLDQDGRDEILVGFGRGGRGWLQAFDDALAGYDYIASFRILSEDYNATNGESRPAIKFQGMKTKSCLGDFDYDGDVDGTDLKTFKRDFGRKDCSGDCPGDFDSDGDIDVEDLHVFEAYFGRIDCD